MLYKVSRGGDAGALSALGSVMLRRVIVALASAAVLLAGAAGAAADTVTITVNKSTQRLHVTINGVMRYEWPVSTARQGYNTPNGVYGVERMARQWYSRRYDWSPMPHSIFFDGGYAIHGSYEISRIGTPASHGCIRLHPANAAVLYALVERNRGSTRIVVTGERPSQFMVRRARPHYAAGEAKPVKPHHRARPHYVEDDETPPALRARVRERHSRESFEDIFN